MPDYRKLSGPETVRAEIAKPGDVVTMKIRHEVKVMDADVDGTLLQVDRHETPDLPMAQWVAWGILSQAEADGLTALMTAVYTRLRANAPRQLRNGAIVIEDIR